MLTKEQLLKTIAKSGFCEGIECAECPYHKHSENCPVESLKRIGAMAILRKHRKSKRKERVFNPDKVLTCVTADKAKVGMKGYFGDDLAEIKSNFEKNNFYELSGVYKENYPCRFINKRNEYALFYPLDEEEE